MSTNAHAILMQNRAREVSDKLLGSCQDISTLATEEECKDADFCRTLDDNVFECNVCGWWCGVEEDVGENICDGCAECDS